MQQAILPPHPLARPLAGRATSPHRVKSCRNAKSRNNDGRRATSTLTPDHLSPARRGRRKAPGEGAGTYWRLSSRKISSRTPSRLSYTSVLVVRTWKPIDSRSRVRRSSRATSGRVDWVAPSISTISLPSSLTKSTIYRSIGCWRRNFQRSSWRLRSARQRRASALVSDARNDRALLLKRSIPLTRALGGPIATGEVIEPVAPAKRKRQGLTGRCECARRATVERGETK